MGEDQYCCHRCYCERCGNKHDNGFCSKCNLYVNPNSFNNYDPRVDNPSNDIREQKALDTMQTLCELMIQQKVKEKQEEKNITEKAANRRTRTPELLDCFKLTYKKRTIPLNNMPEIPLTDAITPDLPIMDSLIMEDEHLSTIPKTESDKLIKSSVKNLVPIPKIISSKIDPHHFNAESDLIESLLNQDISTVSYPKIDYLLEEFSESNSEISDATIKSSSPSPIPVEDSDSLMEEIDLFLDPDDSIPPGILSDDYDSEGDILFLEELLSNDSLSLPETKSFHFDHYDVLSSPRPPAKPPDDGIFFDFKPDTGVLTAKVVEDISEHYVLMPKLLLTQPTLCPDIDTLLPFSSENEDKVFNHGILSYPLLSHRGKIILDFSESPMMISRGNIPLLIAPDFEDSRARDFVHCPLDLQFLACLYDNLIS
ncbi:hypothetical protein Tco_1306041 [Tanacetum coccineum]